MTPSDPPRLVDVAASDGDDLIRTALHAARAEAPSASAIERMLGRFPFPPDGSAPPAATPPDPPLDGGGPGAGAGAAATAGLGLAGGKLYAVVAVVSAVALGGGWVLSRPDSAPRAPIGAAPSAASPAPTMAGAAPESPAGEAAAPMPEASSASSSSSSSSPPLAERAPASPRVLTSATPVASVAAAEGSEVDLLKEAQAALGGRPARALELAGEHQRRFPRGLLGQEREVIRIQALLGLGRAGEARALANAFRERHPRSAHLPRLDAMLGPAPGAAAPAPP